MGLFKNSIPATKYTLQSFQSKNIIPEDGWTLAPPESEPLSLIRAVYEQKQLELHDPETGIYQYAHWLPILNPLVGSSAPITYKSEHLANYLGLKNLYITFSGYWPERGGNMTTCSFKETEAYSVCARIPASENRKLVVASAGNTARAFARVCSDNKIPLVLCVPADNLKALWFDRPIDDCVKLYATASGSDYFDAIRLGDKLAQLPGYFAEGGAKNVARRDGMGTTVLSAVTHIGRIPDYYFQAVGSGTGAIAAWEANLRFIEDGRFGDHKMKLCLSQNAPFQPMYEAWKNDSRELPPIHDALARQQAEHILAKVLSNRKPPYGIPGGLFDAMKDAGAEFYSINNQTLLRASQLFETLEGIDIHPAAAVATASLIEAVKNKDVNPNACIMLNITGGGEKKFRKEHRIHRMNPDHIFPILFSDEEIHQTIK